MFSLETLHEIFVREKLKQDEVNKDIYKKILMLETKLELIIDLLSKIQKDKIQ